MNIIFYGGTGQCKVMRSIADKVGTLTAVLDDTPGLKPPFSDIPLYDGPNCFRDWNSSLLTKWRVDEDAYFAVTIGNPNGQARRDISKRLIEAGLKPISLIHESAIIDEYVEIGTGVQIHAGVVVNRNAKIGDYCILNTKCSVDHDCVLEDGVEIAPGATLCGEIIVGENAWIGAGATILPRVAIGKDAIVGAGAIVLDYVPPGYVVAGVPARRIR